MDDCREGSYRNAWKNTSKLSLQSSIVFGIGVYPSSLREADNFISNSQSSFPLRSGSSNNALSRFTMNLENPWSERNSLVCISISNVNTGNRKPAGVLTRCCCFWEEFLRGDAQFVKEVFTKLLLVFRDRRDLERELLNDRLEGDCLNRDPGVPRMNESPL